MGILDDEREELEDRERKWKEAASESQKEAQQRLTGGKPCRASRGCGKLRGGQERRSSILKSGRETEREARRCQQDAPNRAILAKRKDEAERERRPGTGLQAKKRARDGVELDAATPRQRPLCRRMHRSGQETRTRCKMSRCAVVKCPSMTTEATEASVNCTKLKDGRHRWSSTAPVYGARHLCKSEALADTQTASNAGTSGSNTTSRDIRAHTGAMLPKTNNQISQQRLFVDRDRTQTNAVRTTTPQREGEELGT